MVDRWLGRFLEALDASGHAENTRVVLTTDHGHDLGARGAFGKQWPHFDSHANIPLFVRHPEVPGGGRCDALTATVDLHATLLEAAGADPAPVHGRSLLPLLDGGEPAGREGLVYGTFGQGACCTDGRYTRMKSPEAEGPLYAYSSLIFDSLTEGTLQPPEDQGHFIPGVAYPQWKTPVQTRPRSRENFLFDRRADPEQRTNLWDAQPAERARMLALLARLMEEEGRRRSSGGGSG